MGEVMAIKVVERRATMNNKYVSNEYAQSRVVDADVREATELASSSIKSQMSAQVMSKSTRIKDTIPLTTEHFRSSVLSSTL